MADDEKPSGTIPIVADEEKEEEEGSEKPATGTKHKVIADIHSGMVLVAPVATPVEELEDDDVEPESSEGGKPAN